MLEPLQEGTPIGEPGEAVVVSLAAEIGLESHAVRYIARVHHDTAAERLVEHRADRDVDVARPPVGADGAERYERLRTSIAEGGGDGGTQGRRRGRGQGCSQPAAQQILGPVPQTRVVVSLA